VHQQKIQIAGYSQTSGGRVLQWRNLENALQVPEEIPNINDTAYVKPTVDVNPTVDMNPVVEINKEVSKISRKKFDQQAIDIIMQYQNYPNKKLVVQILEEKHQIKTSLSTLQRIWKGLY
jgi:hypothetical protein